MSNITISDIVTFPENDSKTLNYDQDVKWHKKSKHVKK